MTKKRSQHGRAALRPTADRRWHPRGAVWAAIVLATIGLTSAVLWHRTGAATTGNAERVEAAPAPAQFVGSAACATCHPGETAKWHSSQHHDAMAEATDHTVLGNFKSATFTYAGTTSTFFTRDDGFYVRTDGRDGRLADFRIKYTFG